MRSSLYLNTIELS